MATSANHAPTTMPPQIPYDSQPCFMEDLPDPQTGAFSDDDSTSHGNPNIMQEVAGHVGAAEHDGDMGRLSRL